MKRRDRLNAAGLTEEVGSTPEAHAEDRPSKSQRKRDSHALQDLGERLLALQPARLKALPLPPRLLDAIELALRITSREGLRRQRQYIGRLMREIDAAPILKALDDDGTLHRAEVATMHAAEGWRIRLLETPDALAEFLALYPQAADADGMTLAALIEAARTELARGAAGRRFRELYRHLRDTLTEP